MSYIRMLLLSGITLWAGCSTPTKNGYLAVSPDGKGFVSGKTPFFVWGFNYDRSVISGRDVLLEDILREQPAKLDRDFAMMRQMGGNTVRLFCQMGEYFEGPDRIDSGAFDRLSMALDAADRAGLKPGDLITRIDDTAVKGLSLNDAVKRMRGEPGTKVLLTILRKDENRSFPVTITREEIRTQSVKSKMIEPGYAWLRLSQFQERTVDDFVAKLEDIYKRDPNLKGLVLDLRNDPGGLLDAAVAVSAAFLPEGATVVSTNGQIEESKSIYKARPEDYMRRRGADPLKRLPAALKHVPMVVLVNEGSASASEIVAGALQDHKRAIVMGSQTFGKGSVQTVRPLGPDTALKITTARYYTPNGNSIQAKGIVPDIMVDDTAEGSPYAVLRMREADLEKHLTGAQEDKKDPALEKEREAAMKRLEEESRKPAAQRRPPEYGSAQDFPLLQAIAKLKGQPVKVSKTLVERKEEPKTE